MNAMRSDRNPYIDIMKFVSAIIIMTNHLGMGLSSWGNVNQINYVIVDSFFVISGFLFAKQYEKNKKRGIFKYIIKKITGIYFVYLSAIVIGIVVILINFELFQDRDLSVTSIVLEALMGQQLFININLLNGPDWYVSAWIISIFLYMCLYKLFGKKGDILILLLFISYVIYFCKMGYMPNHTRPYYVIMGGTQRGLCVMALGILVYRGYCRLERYGKTHFVLAMRVLTLITTVSYIICLRYCSSHVSLGIIALFLLSISIVSSYYSQWMFNGIMRFNIVKETIESSMYIYLLHLPASFIFKYLMYGYGGKIGLLGVVVIVVMIISKIDKRIVPLIYHKVIGYIEIQGE
ncbi:acyltransferase [Butyrivibrio sp. INlla16]|uniref:acyltransferase family protein n=1 Tax=Butyrivibrio sp. INlla16 TaxID=1520807 RepID=UPI000882C1C8|nr:acyltransferase [Butyrivibrio sp. INlla16]SDB67338.1 Peptidoglycan/LPS O-acetylase OafA/YrhL, contains acyltransferase and SGNH-hydrolase domains [Butyrivibrio sp. INlla16]